MAGKTTGQNSADVADQIVLDPNEMELFRLRLNLNYWNTELSEVNSQITELTAVQSNLSAYLGEWDTQKSIYDGSENLSEVVRVNVFEGACADKIKADFSACITEMDGTYSKVSRLNENVGAQITRLNQYLSVIYTKLAYLRKKLGYIF